MKTMKINWGRELTSKVLTVFSAERNQSNSCEEQEEVIANLQAKDDASTIFYIRTLLVLLVTIQVFSIPTILSPATPSRWLYPMMIVTGFALTDAVLYFIPLEISFRAALSHILNPQAATEQHSVEQYSIVLLLVDAVISLALATWSIFSFDEFNANAFANVALGPASVFP